MICAARRSRLEALAATLEGTSSVVGVDVLAPPEARDSRPEVDATVRATRRGGLPALVRNAVADANLELCRLREANHPGCLRMVVR